MNSIWTWTYFTLIERIARTWYEVHKTAAVHYHKKVHKTLVRTKATPKLAVPEKQILMFDLVP